MIKELSVYMSDDGNKKAVILIDLKEEILTIEFYENDKIVKTKRFPDNSIYYVEDAAENWVQGIMSF